MTQNNNDPFSGGYVPFGFTPGTLAEKRDIRRRALIIGVPALLFFPVMLWWRRFLVFMLYTFGMSYSSAGQLLNNPAVRQAVQIAMSLLCFTVPYIVSLRICGITVDETVSAGKPKKGFGLPFFLFGIGVCSFANVAISCSGRILENFGLNYEVTYSDLPTGFWGFMLCFLSSAAVPALAEEFAFRGVMIGVLRKYGEGFALIVSSVIFGVMHGNFEQMPFAAAVGMILGMVYIKTGSLWVSVAVHAANNLVSLSLDFLRPLVSEDILNVYYNIYIAAAILSAVAGVLLLAAKNDAYTLKEPSCECTNRQKYSWFFTSPAVIAFLVVFVANAFRYFVV